MNFYTVIGVYADNGQIFVETCQAKNPKKAAEKYPDVEIVGVFEGCCEEVLHKEGLDTEISLGDRAFQL